MPLLSPAERKIFATGLLVRLACVPFLLQWFHADERQFLEFSHFHAHGRLHPFMEVGLQMRNQTAPWVFSWLVRLCDEIGLSNPRAWLWAMDILIAVWTWLGFWALIRAFQGLGSNSRNQKVALGLGWFFFFFCAFPWLWSRPLSETLSFTPAAFLFLSLLRERWAQAGFWAGLAGILRYPSFLWAPGGLLLALWQLKRRRAPGRVIASGFALGAAGFLCALALGGLAYLQSYVEWLKSFPAYFAFNRPGGPVSALFGEDSLWSYGRWFEYVFTPWLAYPLLVGSGVALWKQPALVLFIAPYVLGHLWTPHREPRFMLPLTPFLVWSVAAWVASESGEKVILSARDWLRPRPWIRRSATALILIHFAIHLAWYPALAWAQTWSGQAILLRSYTALKKHRTDFLNFSESPIGAIDAWIPPETRWSGHDCKWHRPEPAMEPERLWVMTRDTVPPTCRLLAGLEDLNRYRLAERWLRVRFANLYQCPLESLSFFCPRGIEDAPPGEPYFGRDLGRDLKKVPSS